VVAPTRPLSGSTNHPIESYGSLRFVERRQAGPCLGWDTPVGVAVNLAFWIRLTVLVVLFIRVVRSLNVVNEGRCPQGPSTGSLGRVGCEGPDPGDEGLTWVHPRSQIEVAELVSEPSGFLRFEPERRVPFRPRTGRFFGDLVFVDRDPSPPCGGQFE
jgi:hypothetical protein